MDIFREAARNLKPGEAKARRVELGNGHRMWLETKMIEWSYIREIGSAFDKIVDNPDKTDLIEALIRNKNPHAATGEENFRELKKEFQQLGLDPSSVDVGIGPWRWSSYFLMAVKIGQTCLAGQPPPTKQEMAHIYTIGLSHTHGYYANFNAWLHGSQTFEITLPLASKLMLTDPGHVTWKDFHFPFPSYVIQLPPLAVLHDPHTGAHQIDTIIMVDGVHRDRRRIEMYFMARENEKSVYAGDDSTLYSAIWCGDEDETVEFSIKNTDPHSHNNPMIDNEIQMGGMRGDSAVKQLMRFACCVNLYITSHPEDRQKKINPEINKLHREMKRIKGKKKERAKKKLKKLLGEPRPYVVGTKVTISPELKKVARKIARGKTAEVEVASYVRGHHKMQAHGPLRSLRRMIWIEPYWRGLGPKTTKTYTVK